MFRRRLNVILLLIIISAGATSCDYPSATPVCEEGDLISPELISPELWEVVTGSHVVLEWSYGDESCEPEGYQIVLSQNRDFSPPRITGGTGDSSTTWSPSSPLDPATEYYWRVAAMAGTTVGPYSTHIKSFFTEPICDPSNQAAPILDLPEPGGIFERGYSSLEWTYPFSTCIPESYRVELSTDPDFADTSLFGATGNPSTRWGPGSPLDPATQYFWRISSSVAGVQGPYSITHSFFTDPVCDPVGLSAPDRLEPAEGAELTTATPLYTWSYPDASCAPEGFRLEISTTPDMSSLAMMADNPQRAYLSFQAGYPLADCQTYYWRTAVYADGTRGPFSDIGSFSINLTGDCACELPDLVAPELVWPGPYEIIPDLIPILDWNYPGSCDPTSYLVSLSRWHDFSDTSLFGATGTSNTSWAPGTELEPATQYWWKVAGATLTDAGPYSSNRSFFTGPECSYVGTVGTPQLISPANGGVVDTTAAVLRYEPGGDPGCIPDGYLLNLQTDPTLGGTNLLAEYGLPATTVITEPLNNCTRYYWTATAVQDGSYGPASDIGWFYTNQDGLCPIPGIPGLMRMNTFCRSGTYPEHFAALHTFEVGDFVEAVAQNPLGTYLLVQIPGPDGLVPEDSLGTCWITLESADLWGDHRVLQVEKPPEKPIEKPEVTETPPACSRDLSQDQCKAAGGTWFTPTSYQGDPYCKCP